MTDVLDQLFSVPPMWAYAVIAALVLAESALFVGFVLPGEAAVLIGGVLAATGRLELATLVPLVIAAAIVGDAIGFAIGRRFGPWILRRKALLRHTERVDRMRSLLARRGGMAVLIGRLTALLRAMTPPLAGMSHMTWRKFLVFDVIGGVIWAGGVAMLGYTAGASYRRVADTVGNVSAGLLVAVVVIGLIAWQVRRREHRA